MTNAGSLVTAFLIALVFCTIDPHHVALNIGAALVGYVLFEPCRRWVMGRSR